MKEFKIKFGEQEEIKNENETYQIAQQCGAGAGFLNMLRNMRVTEGMFHYDSMTEFIRLK
jgi:hypothetical protein